MPPTLKPCRLQLGALAEEDPSAAHIAAMSDRNGACGRCWPGCQVKDPTPAVVITNFASIGSSSQTYQRAATSDQTHCSSEFSFCGVLCQSALRLNGAATASGYTWSPNRSLSNVRV